MFNEISYDIITRTVLNEASGELEQVDFRQVKEKKQIKGGFGMYYKSYEDAVGEVINSNLEWKIWIDIKNHFTYQRVESSLVVDEIAKKLECSDTKVKLVIKKAIEAELLMRVARGIYRLNPFMILPYRADGAELQREWKELQEKKRS
jgi:hypothetical protein